MCEAHLGLLDSGTIRRCSRITQVQKSTTTKNIEGCRPIIRTFDVECAPVSAVAFYAGCYRPKNTVIQLHVGCRYRAEIRLGWQHQVLS